MRLVFLEFTMVKERDVDLRRLVVKQLFKQNICNCFLIVFAASNIFSGVELPSLTIPKDFLKISSSSAELLLQYSMCAIKTAQETTFSEPEKLKMKKFLPANFPSFETTTSLRTTEMQKSK